MENKKYEWDLDDLLNNKSLDDLYAEFEAKKAERIKAFATFLDSKENFAQWQVLEEEFTIIANRFYNYVSNNLNTNVVDPKWNSWSQKLSASFYELETALSNYDSVILANEAKIKEYLKDPQLSVYTRKYNEIFRYQPHTLNDEQSKLYSKLARADEGFSTIYSTYTNNDMKFADAIDSKGKKHPINNEAEAFVHLKAKDRALRKSAYLSMYKAYYDSRESITKMLYYNYLSLNQQAKAKNFEDYIAKAAFDDVVDKSLITLIYDQVKLYKEANEDYKKARNAYLKKLIKVSKIEPWDNALPLISKKIDISIEEAKQMSIDSLSILGDEYVSNIKRAFDEKWVSWLPQKGKRGGAYSIGGTKGISKYYILMNYTNSLRDVQTIVHELGHSMHSLYSNRTQKIYSDYKIFYAEIASISNEVYLNYYLLEKYKDDLEMKLMILDEMISGFFATTTRQVIFSNFEWIANELINSGAPFTADVVMKEYQKLEFEYTNKPIVEDLTSIYSLSSVTPLRIPHFYVGNFYVYKYAVGQVAAIISGHRVFTKVEGAKQKVFDFLSSGGSKDPLDTIKLLGVDLTQPQSWQEALEIVKLWIKDYKQTIVLLNKKKSKK